MDHLAEVRPIGPYDPLSEPSLARELVQRYLVWDAYVAGARRVDVHPLILPRALHERAVHAAESVTRAVGLAASRAYADDEERARYRLHPSIDALASASRAAGDSACIARVDLLLGEDGDWHACEVNSDCAGGYNEALGLPRLARAAGFSGAVDPTHVVSALIERLAQLSRGDAVGLVHATAYAEDLQVCALLQGLLEKRGVRALLLPPTAPRLRSGALMARGEKLGALYRYFPAEYMEGQDNLGDIVAAVRAGAVRTLSSFEHIYLQSKLAFARAWSLAPELDESAREAIRAHVPESLDTVDISRTRLVAERPEWVLKRAYGRVGDQVYVGALHPQDEWERIVDEARALRAKRESWIAQRFVKQRTIPTPWGDRYVTLGAYVLDGTFAGYFARITATSHVSHEALCVPVFAEMRGAAGAGEVTS